MKELKCIAFYLPQFHPIPENDEWWGKGFTEWHNVVKARPLFKGHYQPHIPADLGFYDLRLPEVREAQAALAKAHGIYGFCYYHYWFNGHKILDLPLREIHNTGSPDFPFCLCWANENWTRAWDGRSGQILLEQRYSFKDDLAHIEHLLPIFADRRYIRICGRPLFLVYRTELMPDPMRTADIWRSAAFKAGIGNIFLARVESFQTGVIPSSIGFDAAVEFAPDWHLIRYKYYGNIKRRLSRLGLFPKSCLGHHFINYNDMARDMLAKPETGYPRYRCVTPSFDNSPRRKKQAMIFLNSTPKAYGRWLSNLLLLEQRVLRSDDERIVFINAWNEWAEGNYLEPDQHWGRAFLEATRDAVRMVQSSNERDCDKMPNHF